MGAALSWVVVEGLDFDAILARLDLETTGAPCEYPIRGIAAQPFPDGRWLIEARGCDHVIVGEASMAALSSGGRALSCTVEEHVNYVACALWEGGTRVWRVEHAGDEAPDHIACEGAVPASFGDVLAAAEEASAADPDVDYFMDIPLNLAREFAGYCHEDVAAAPDETPFLALRRRAPHRPWWRKLFRS